MARLRKGYHLDDHELAHLRATEGEGLGYEFEYLDNGLALVTVDVGLGFRDRVFRVAVRQMAGYLQGGGNAAADLIQAKDYAKESHRSLDEVVKRARRYVR